jgi:hypothetical protein
VWCQFDPVLHYHQQRKSNCHDRKKSIYFGSDKRKMTIKESAKIIFSEDLIETLTTFVEHTQVGLSVQKYLFNSVDSLCRKIFCTLHIKKLAFYL